MSSTLPRRPAADPVTAPSTGPLQVYRDDGPVCAMLGRLAQGQLPPLPGVLVAVLVTAVLLIAGAGEVSGPALFAPLAALLLTGPASTHPHSGRLDWLVPPFIRAIEYGYVAVLGFAYHISAPLIYTLIAVLVYHHYDTVYRTRQKLWPQKWVFTAGLGWEGRMLVLAAAGLVGVLPFAYAALAVFLGVIFVVESVHTWSKAGRGTGVMVDLEQEEETGS
ncbi:MAG TPA: DUF5941 domain-containing protein [Actinomadura sp.]|jgi:hypothetical protein|nr:DUF5941 domain-containing protein [Actinomadura sp.]